MGYQARLVYGQRVIRRLLNLVDTTYSLHTFAPPPLTSGGEGEVDIYKLPDRAISFDVRILGGSIPETHGAVARIQEMLDLAKDESDRLYFEFTPTDDVPYRQIIFGQYGAPYRYWIKSGFISMSGRLPYDTGGETREKALIVTLNLVCAAWAEGIEQRIGMAKGGVLEDTIATPNRISRGLIIPPVTGAGGNLITNPVFDNANWVYGWSLSTGITATANYDPRYIIHGNASAYVTNSNAAAQQFTFALTAGSTANHVLSIYAKLSDGGVISATQCSLFYATVKTTTYTPVGNGWYRLSVEMAGIASLQNAGIEVNPGYGVYVDGAQFEPANYVTPLCVGDMLGCAWAGTRHASASTRAVGALKYDISIIDRGQGTLRIVWKSPHANTEYGSDSAVFFDASGTHVFIGYFAGADDKYYFTIGSDTVSSSATTFSAGDIIVMHFVWGPVTMKIYVNGSQVATGSAFSTPTLDPNIFIGTDTVPAQHSMGTYMGLASWNRILTATEIANEYSAIYDHITGGDGYGQQLEALPYFWTKDGDGVLDNVDDTNRDNWGAMGGIQGSLPAYLLADVYPSAAESVNYIHASVPYFDFILPTNQWYNELSGTSDTAGSSGEAYQSVTMSGAGSTSIDFNPAKPWLWNGNFHFFMRAAVESGANLTVTVTPYAVLGPSSGTKLYGNPQPCVLTTTYKWYSLGRILGNLPGLVLDHQKLNITVGILLEWGAGASHTGKLDYLMVVNGGYLRMIEVGSATWAYIIFNDREVFTEDDNAYSINFPEDRMPTRGEFIQPQPHKYTLLWFSNADHNSAHVLENTCQMNYASNMGLHITSRYGLL